MNTYQKFLRKSYSVRTISDFRDLVYGSEERYGAKTAFFLKDHRIDYRKFKNDYQSLCTAFLARGYAGKKIAIIGANSYGWILSYLSAATVGVVVPIDRELCCEDMVGFMKAANCSALIADSSVLEEIRPLIRETVAAYSTKDDVSRLLEEGGRQYAGGMQEIDRMPIRAEELSILIFTSGTTGSAKGVCLSQKNICANIHAIAKMVKVNHTRHALSILPLHHTYEATIGHLLLLSAGGCISYCDGLRYIAKNIEEYRPSTIIAVPRLLDAVLNKIEKSVRKGLPDKYLKHSNDLSFNQLLRRLPFYVKPIIKRKVKASLGGKLDLLIVGAAAVKPEVVEAFCQLGIKTYQGYGLTECAPLLAGNNDFYMNPHSTGLPIHGVEIKIDRPNAEGIGEILAKGENIMLGYYNDAEATKAAMAGGYFRTGDLGRMDANGFLYITGRKKNVIVTQNGKNIYPEELETRLVEESAVAEVLVFGVPDGRGDTAVAARILPDLGFISAFLHGSLSKPSKEDIHKAVQAAVNKVNDRLPTYKRVRTVEILGKALERTTTQKIKRYGANIEL